MRFLWEQGIRCIPQQIVVSPDRGWAIYEFAGDSNLASSEVKESDIDFAIDFLVDLKNLKKSPDSAALPTASEASFSLKAIVENIWLRLIRLQQVESATHDTQALARFLSDEFNPALNEIDAWCQSQSKNIGVSFASELDVAERTLSPSDFGFHNAVRRNDGSIVFLDLEYFGWDDPAKTVSDFLLHPAMNLPHDLLRRFTENMISRFSENQELAKRIRLVYPLFGLKWCMILLNEFLPERMARRRFASGQTRTPAELRTQQLAKAKGMLARTNRELERFPYLD